METRPSLKAGFPLGVGLFSQAGINPPIDQGQVAQCREAGTGAQCGVGRAGQPQSHPAQPGSLKPPARAAQAPEDPTMRKRGTEGGLG